MYTISISHIPPTVHLRIKPQDSHSKQRLRPQAASSDWFCSGDEMLFYEAGVTFLETEMHIVNVVNVNWDLSGGIRCGRCGSLPWKPLTRCEHR
jgi:hypothetical protein